MRIRSALPRLLAIPSLTLLLTACGGGGASQKAALAPGPELVLAERDARPGVTQAALPAGLLAAIPADAEVVGLLDVEAIIRSVGDGSMLFGRDVGDDATLRSLHDSLDMLGTSPEFVGEFGSALRFSRLRSMAFGFSFLEVDGEKRPNVVLLMDADAITRPPEDGAAASAYPGEEGLSWARRGDRLYLGAGPLFDDALAGRTRGGFRANGWTRGLDAIPADAAVALLAPDLTRIPESARREIAIEGKPVERFLAWATLDGEVQVSFAGGDDQFLHAMFGQAQSSVAFVAEMVRQQLPGAAGAWGNYIELANQAFWSGVTIETRTGLTTIRLAPAECGSPVKYPLLVGAAVFGAEEQLRNVDGIPTTRFKPTVRPPTTGCDNVEGPPPKLPTALLRIATDDTTQPAFALLADQGALLRSILPDLLGLLPVRLRLDAIEQAVGPNPLGMNGLADPEAPLFGYVETLPPGTQGADDQPTVLFFALPAGSAELLPRLDDAPVQRVIPDVGLVVSNATGEARLSNASPPADWLAALSGLPDDALAVLVANRGVIDAFLLTAEDSSRELMRGIQYAAVSFADTSGLEVSFVVPMDAAAFEDRFRARLDAWLRESYLEGAAEDDREAVERSLERLRDVFTIRVLSDDVVAVRLDFRKAASAMLPASLAWSRRAQAESSAFAARSNILWIADTSFNAWVWSDEDPKRFPEPTGPTPSLDVLAATCEATGFGIVAMDYDAFANDPTWAELGFTPWDGTYHYRYDSGVEGGEPWFEVTAMADRDCDGVFHELKLRGWIANGEVVQGEIVEKNPLD